MRGKDLLECMEQIDDALVEEALEPAVFPRRNAKAVKWGMAAACVVVLGISATAFWSHQNMKKMPIEHAGDTAAPMSAAAGADSGSSGQLAEGAPTDAGAADGTGQLAGVFRQPAVRQTVYRTTRVQPAKRQKTAQMRQSL